ncbi:hypothetical protein ACN47E_006746 [Coniothyrium glycines]
MNLTAYSDSESDSDSAPAPKPAPKPGFQKVVDRSNPGRIKVSLPGTSQQHAPKDDVDAKAPPAKKPRLAGAGLSGFNAMLPAPKKANPSAATAGTGAISAKRGLGKRLGGGVNLKTGAEPAFKREPRVDIDEYDENGNPMHKEPMNKEDFRAMLSLPPPKTKISKPSTLELPAAAPEGELTPEQPQATKATPRFVPMSVGKGKKKKPVAPRAIATTENKSILDVAASVSQPVLGEVKPAPPRPKVSLFGVADDTKPAAASAPDDQYQPLLYGAVDEHDRNQESEPYPGQPVNYTTQPSAAATNDLTGIASELNLSEAERRQLFGRQGQRGPDFSGARIIEFNTDTEYAHNEKLRQQGEQVQHNPLKSISGTGKNSLRSLVNVAATQKDALEDHFATGYRNKKEAGNRYGW